jgi:hypothetical protein
MDEPPAAAGSAAPALNPAPSGELATEESADIVDPPAPAAAVSAAPGIEADARQGGDPQDGGEDGIAPPSASKDPPASEATAVGRPSRKRDRDGDAGLLDPGRVTQAARTGGLLTTASSRQQTKALIDEAVFRRERNLDMYHAVESLCFYNAKEISTQMEVIDGALTLRVPHGPTCMRAVVADLLASLPVHILALRQLSKRQAEEWFPADDTHWGLESAEHLPGYMRRALTLLETLCEVAASGKHRRLYQQITTDVIDAAQNLVTPKTPNPKLQNPKFRTRNPEPRTPNLNTKFYTPNPTA